MRCSANDRCYASEPDRNDLLVEQVDDELYEQYDRYGIYAGRWHDDCWDTFGYKDFVFDPSYAGERLEEDY